MHELPQSRIVFDLSVHIQDMRLVPEQCAGFSDCPVNVIDWVAAAQHIMLCDEDDIGFVQLLIFIAGFGHIFVDQTAVIPSTLDASTFIAALNLDIVNAVCFIDGQNIQPYRAPLQILNIVLTVDTLHLQVCALQDDLQQEFGTGRILEHLVHEIVVQQAQTAKPL